MVPDPAAPNPARLAADIRLAWAHYAAGRRAEAEAVCRTVLRRSARHAGALHLLAVMSHAAGRLAQALYLARTAVAAAPHASGVRNATRPGGATGATGIAVDRSADGESFTPIATLGASATGYLDTTASPGAQYWYEVKEVQGDAASPPSNVATATTLPALDSLTATDDSDSSNMTTASSTAAVDLYVPETLDSAGQPAGSATIDLSAALNPGEAGSGPGFGRDALWTVSSPTGIVDSGDFTTDPTVTLTPTGGNYNFTVQAGIETDGETTLTQTEATRTINVYVYTIQLEFNNTPDMSDDMVMLSTPAHGSDIPANQPVLDAAVRAVGDPPPGLEVSLDNPDGRSGFAAETPSPSPASQPSSPVSTTPSTSIFSLSAGGGWLHLPVVGLQWSLNVSKNAANPQTATAPQSAQNGGHEVTQNPVLTGWATGVANNPANVHTYGLLPTDPKHTATSPNSR